MKLLSFNINFELATLILLFVLHFYLSRHYYGRSKINDGLRRVVFAEIVLICFDIISTITITFIKTLPLWLNYLTNTMYFALIGATTLFLVYFIEIFSEKDEPYKKLNHANQIVYIAYVILLIVNIPTGIVFSLKGRKYTHGSIYDIVYIYPALLLLECIIIFFCIRSSIDTLRRGYLIFLLAFSAVGPALQLFVFPNVLLSNVTPGLSMFMGLLLVVSPNYNELVNRKKDLEKAKAELEKEVVDRTQESRIKEEKSAAIVSETVEALKTMIDDSNVNKRNHTANVSNLSVLIAKELGMGYEEREKIYQMALVHDIGLIGIDEDVALKNGVYTEEERREMERHTVIGDQILKAITELPDLSVAARSHHERFDGKGYPDHLKGNEIPIYARIVCVADAYDAMTEPRPYRQVFTDEDVKEEFERCSGKQFDPKIVRALFHVLEKGLYTPTEIDSDMGLTEF